MARRMRRRGKPGRKRFRKGRGRRIRKFGVDRGGYRL